MHNIEYILCSFKYLNVSSSPAVKVTFLEPQALALLCTLCRDSLPSSAKRFNPRLPFKIITSVVWLSNLPIISCLVRHQTSKREVPGNISFAKSSMNMPVNRLGHSHPGPLRQNEQIGLQAEVVESKHLISYYNCV